MQGRNIKSRQGISLSNIDINNLLFGRGKIINYPELKKYKNIEQLLDPDGFAVILALQGPNYGHWIAVIQIDDKTIEVFDSYGIGIDCELDFIKDKRLSDRLDMSTPYLSMLLWECKDRYNLTINHHKFQKEGHNIATCGRHVCVRIWNKEKQLKDYKKYMYGSGYDPDVFVTELTDLIRKKYIKY